MVSALAPVVALLVSVSILLAGQGLQTTLLPVRASLENFSTLSIGIIGAVYFLGFTTGCLKGGAMVQRVGHVRVFLAMTALASASPLVHGLVVDEFVWAVLRFLTGFCFAVLYVVIESWLNEQASDENRGTIFATYVMITLTLLAGGQMMVLLYEPGTLHLFALASVLVSVAAVPIALSSSPTPALPEFAHPDLRKLFRTSPGGTFGCLATGLANGSFWSLAPVFTSAASEDISLAAWFMTGTVLGGSIGQWPLGILSDRISRRSVLIAASACAAAAGLVLVFFAPRVDFLTLTVLGAVWGSVAFPIYSLSVAHTNDYADTSDFVMISSSLLLIYGIGAVTGPFIASAAMTVAGPQFLYVFTAAVHTTFLVYVITRVFRREPAPEEQHIQFTAALAAAATASRVYEDEFEHLAEHNDEPAGDNPP